MLMPDIRRDPGAILASLHRKEMRARRGRLKIFFGMCPGVGKTFAMLQAAQRELIEGTDVVVGLVETHGRRETEALLAGMPVIQRKRIEHLGVTLTELDLDAVLERMPQLVIVDELAHANAPGSRHPKRHQDIVELLDAGIDVFSTLNVQHLESRADAVRQITGAPVQETVPDSVAELADQIELIDLTPETLRERMSDGKLFFAESAGDSAEHFFNDTNLTALRELALRFVAERVDQRLRELRGAGFPRTVWRSGERLLVAVGPSPFSTQLVRWTRRMASAQGAAWIAVNVESSRQLTVEARRRLEQNLALARELGGEVVVTHDEDLAEALVRVAIQHNATQIVVGKPRGPRLLNWLRGGGLVNRLLQLGGSIDIYVVPPERAAGKSGMHVEWQPPGASPAREYGEVFAALALITGVGWLLTSIVGYESIGLLYLLAVIALSLRVGRWPVITAGVVSALSWNFLFMPPLFTFVLAKFEDGMLFATYFVVAMIAGQLTARIRAQERNERIREERAMALFHLTRTLAEARTLNDAVSAALRQVDRLFDAKTVLLLHDSDGLCPHSAGSFALDDKERGVAEWVFAQRRVAGRFTDTLAASAGYYMPLLRSDRAIGILGVRVSPSAQLTLAQRDLLEAFARQLALSIEQEHLREASAREKVLVESEKLHRTLLDSVSHELRTPLAVISSSLESLPEATPALRKELTSEARTAARRLNRLVGNLLDQTRLESGVLKPKLDWCDPRDLVNAAIEDVSDTLAGHPLEISIPAEMQPVRADFALTVQALANLLLNASRHTPAATPVFITAGVDRSGTRAFFTVADRGPGFPPGMRERLFKKFERGGVTRSGGLGLGLSIVRGFVLAQSGEIVVGENPGGGAVFTIYLPHTAPQTPLME